MNGIANTHGMLRYAYSPVIDVDTEEMEQLPSDAYGKHIIDSIQFYCKCMLLLSEGMRLRDMNPGEEKDKQRKSTTAVRLLALTKYVSIDVWHFLGG